ncbi:hypothetical protein HFO61_30555 [Rhizobium leguminosarum]|uniref:hypothetical protein n=1 Tax=Rhizobium leguminosarum TaxID=384 RepID=UPI001C9741BC|nr:hypothetical protein [Rhizobium leguminosarum]MBY5551088.1 hypothetical protein [Rhizobium leguminosarum]
MSPLKIFLKPYIGMPIALLGGVLINAGWIWLGAAFAFSYAAALLLSVVKNNSLKSEVTWAQMVKIAVFAGVIAVFVVPVIYQRSARNNEEDQRLSLMFQAKELCPGYLALPDSRKGQWREYGFCNVRKNMGDAAWREEQASYLDGRGRHDDAERMRNGGKQVAAVDAQATTASTEAEPAKATPNALWK